MDVLKFRLQLFHTWRKAQRFAENRIDLSVLPDLTDQHLKDLGVALGDRLKMLRTIGQLTACLQRSQPASLRHHGRALSAARQCKRGAKSTGPSAAARAGNLWIRRRPANLNLCAEKRTKRRAE
jgi:hypothetical protein